NRVLAHQGSHKEYEVSDADSITPQVNNQIGLKLTRFAHRYQIQMVLKKEGGTDCMSNLPKCIKNNKHQQK
ncbi:unnamed protein product, partial [Callosobruchus maculatus]